WDGELRQLVAREQEEREVETGLREVTKAKNMVVHQEEIVNRPKREWFQSEAEKSASKRKADAQAKKREEKKRQKKKLKEEEKKKNWIPEEEMTQLRQERRAKARELQAQKEAAAAAKGEKNLLSF